MGFVDHPFINTDKLARRCLASGRRVRDFTRRPLRLTLGEELCKVPPCQARNAYSETQRKRK